MDIKDKIWNLMLKNRRTFGPYQYTVPSTDSYPYQWLWDSCFHAIILLYFNIEDAKKELLSLVSHQFENGMIPHMIYWDKSESGDFPVIEWGREDTSTITQPPMLAFAAYAIYQKDGDKNFLVKIYPNLKRFYNYFINERDPRRNHLIGIINPDESGEDNSPRFDITLKLPSKHDFKLNFDKRLELVSKHSSYNFEIGTYMRNLFWVKDVPFNVIMVKNLDCLSKIAKILGFLKDSEYFSNQQIEISKAMEKLMFEDGLFWSTFGLDYQKIKVKTWAIFAPLFAKLYSERQVEILLRKFLHNKNEFKTNYIVPTVSKDEVSYNPKDFWRGPVWIAVNWFIFKGLINYGLKKEAKEVADASFKLLKKSGFREWFNPDTGEGLGAKEFTWGGLVLDMI